MIDTIIIFQQEDPIFKKERTPHCPECHSSDIKFWYDPETYETRGICQVCDHEDKPDNF